MHESADEKSIRARLYPPVEPFDRRMIDAGEGHTLYVEQSGNAKGVPVVVLHGGPGGGCSPAMRRFFNPHHYRIILFDQRGCGRSKPFASVENNTTWDLVRDIETIRKELEIESWHVFGGSWGATLSLIYAIAHPETVKSLTLRGVFLGRQSELDWFYGGGAGAFWPDVWQRFLEPIPEAEQGDLIAAYHKRLFGNNAREALTCAQAWTAWENTLASIHSEGNFYVPNNAFCRAFARLENHYFHKKLFLESDNFILENAAKIAHIPTKIVQGRYDMICPPVSAHALATALTKAELQIVGLSGHALSEPRISAALAEIMDDIAQQS
jgi:proline iminopeptidase